MAARPRVGMLLALALLASGAARAAEASAPTELSFADFFQRPVGPRGLVPTQRLLALDGQTVRIHGYMVRAALPVPGVLLLAPLPVELGDEDESYADDLPASVVYVHLDATRQTETPASRPGVVAMQGRLELGARGEADGRISFVRLRLDAEASQELSTIIAR